jgi:hypothetical protein
MSRSVIGFIGIDPVCFFADYALVRHGQAFDHSVGQGDVLAFAVVVQFSLSVCPPSILFQGQVHGAAAH